MEAALGTLGPRAAAAGTAKVRLVGLVVRAGAERGVVREAEREGVGTEADLGEEEQVVVVSEGVSRGAVPAEAVWMEAGVGEVEVRSHRMEPGAAAAVAMPVDMMAVGGWEAHPAATVGEVTAAVLAVVQEVAVRVAVARAEAARAVAVLEAARAEGKEEVVTAAAVREAGRAVEKVVVMAEVATAVGRAGAVKAAAKEGVVRVICPARRSGRHRRTSSRGHSR